MPWEESVRAYVALAGVYMIPEWVSFQYDTYILFHVYIEVLILEWKCGKNIGGSNMSVMSIVINPTNPRA